MATREELVAGLKAADAAGNEADARHFADLIQRLPEPITGYTKQSIERGSKLSGGKLFGARASELANGLALGWGDELSGVMGGLDSLIRGKSSGTGKESFGEGYDAAAKGVRQNLAQYETERPLEALGVSAAGSIPLVATGGASALAKASLPTRILSAMKQGATFGAIAGAGAADGDVGERAGGAGLGALMGGGLGVAIPIIPATVKGGVRLFNRSRMGPEKFAAHYISKALNQDAIPTTEPALMDPGKSIVNVGGRATTAAAEQGALSGEGRNTAERFFDSADQGREGKLLSSIKKTISDIPLYDKLEEQATKRSTDAKPLYVEAYSAPYRRTPRLVDLSKRPAVGGAAKGAVTRLLNDPDLNPDEVREAMTKVFGKDLANLSDEEASRRLTQAMGTRPTEFKVFDYIKRSLDGMANEPSASNEVRRLRNAWREELKTINPKYQEALNSWAGPSRVLEALEEGRQFHKMDPEAITKAMSTMGDSEREAFQIGVSRNLQDAASGANTRAPGQRTSLSLADAISGNKVMQRRLQAALGSEGAQPESIISRNGWKPSADGYRNATQPGKILTFDKNNGVWSLEQDSKSGKFTTLLNSGVDVHSLETALTGKAPKPSTGPQSVDELIAIANNISDEASKKQQIIKGSQTARRLEGSKDFDQLGQVLEHVGEGAKAAQHGVWNFLSHITGKTISRAMDGLSEERRAAVAQLLFSKDPAEKLKGLQMIDAIRSGKKVDPKLYTPKIAPRVQGALITSGNTQGEQ